MVSTIEAHIVSHYREDRARQLDLVLSAMAEWQNCIVRAVITSNVDRYATTGLLAPYQERFAAKGHTLSLNVVDNLTNPRMLTWEHKKFMQPWLEHASPGEDFFLYIEDDIVLTNANILYFLRRRKQLKAHDLIPGFIRYETKGDEVRVVDILKPEYWERERSIDIKGVTFHANAVPYWAGFIMDRELVEEYVVSRSFTPKGSEFIQSQIQERSAFGLTFERPLKRLGSRVVVPIIDAAPDPDCLVWHCSNTYSAEDHPTLAVMTVEQAFRREAANQNLGRRVRQAVRKAVEGPGRLIWKVYRGLS
jgi:hypothetical protein